ncbi:MAG: UvrB/UvrC motif-containing protein [Planctomycetota bacterium]
MTDLPDRCDSCSKEAVYHDTRIDDEGGITEIHACESCAAAQGLGPTQQPINELLSSFVVKPAEAASEQVTTKVKTSGRAESCGTCGTSFREFKRSGLLGCPQCYSSFEPQLSSLLGRAHEGATHHVGKVPKRALSQVTPGDPAGRLEALLGSAEERAERRRTLRRQIDAAVTSEQYERAAQLRDELRAFDDVSGPGESSERTGDDGDES